MLNELLNGIVNMSGVYFGIFIGTLLGHFLVDLNKKR